MLQAVIPGCVGAFVTFVMAGVVFPLTTTPLPFVVFGGLVVGFLTWLFGLVADRASGERLLLTVLYAALGFLVSYLLLLSWHWLQPRADVAQPLVSALAIAVAIGAVLAPLAGAMAGYYWVAGKQRATPP